MLCLAKREVTESNTQYAQGGIAAALSDEDEIGLHLEDTLKAGDGLCNEEAARILVEEGPQRIEELIDWGTQFDRDGTKLAFTREGAHSRSRVLHAHGDSTGREIGRALVLESQSHARPSPSANSSSPPNCWCEMAGVRRYACSINADQLHEIRAGAVLLATGGLGQRL